MKTIKLHKRAGPARPARPALRLGVWRHVFDAFAKPQSLHNAQFRALLADRAYCRFAGVTEARALGQALQNMAAKFHTMFELSPEAIMLLDERGFFDCNPATLRVFDCPTRDDFISKHPAQFSPPTQPGGEDSVSLANQRIATAFKNGNHQFEWQHCRLDSTEFPAEVWLTALELDGRPVLQATVRDISKSKQSEQALARANHALRTLSDCNEALVRAANESELLDSICLLIVETGGYRMAWIGFPEQNAAKTVRPVAQYGRDDGFLAAANISWSDSERGRGPSGMAIRTGTVQVMQSFLTEHGAGAVAAGGA